MEIKPKFQFVEGSFDTQRVKLLCIPDDNHGRVDLCINAHDADGVISKPAVPAKVIRRGRFGSEYARIRCDAITIKADSR